MPPLTRLYEFLSDAYDGNVTEIVAYTVAVMTIRATVRGFLTPQEAAIIIAVVGVGVVAVAHASPQPTRDIIRDHIPMSNSDNQQNFTETAAFADENNPPGSHDADQPDEEDKPDPSEVESIDTSKHIYQRDEEGELIPEQDVVKLGGEWVKIEHVPPTRGFLQRIETQFAGREDIDMDEMDGLMADFYVDPDIEEDELEDASASFYITLMWHMIEAVQGDADDDVMQDLEHAVEERQQEQQGN